MILESIDDVIHTNIGIPASVIDIFTGSGSVASFFKNKSYLTACNDILYFSYVMAKCAVELSETPDFGNLPFKDDCISYLNNLKIDDTSVSINDCFIYNNYSPVGGRMYFTCENALKIDIIRITIENWHNENAIDDNGYYYLLSSLLNAVPYISNITGVYAAYLKFWDKRALKPLILEKPLITDNGRKNICFNRDYTELLDNTYDLMYADPPYNSREYLPNYHILETIAKYDYPDIHGITGMRNYGNSEKSDFCRKNKVNHAFETLIRDSKSKYMLISYNNEGLMPTSDLVYMCKEYSVNNEFKLYEYDYRRYKSKFPNNKDGLKEQLYFLRRR
ncbi:MAG: DNA adenine methylase [Ruminococcus sp.]|nr:DNA adenine methylase [Ruminococcus sp.]